MRGTPKRLEQAGSLLPTPPHGAMSEGVEVTVLRDQVGRAGEKETNVSHFICLILRDPIDCSLPGSSIHGIFQAKVLERI